MCCRSLRPILVKSPGTRLARELRLGWGESLYRSQPLPDSVPLRRFSLAPFPVFPYGFTRGRVARISP